VNFIERRKNIIELNKVHCVDCVEGMKLLPENFVDLTVTSPPYDNIRDYKKGIWNLDLHKVGEQLFRITKDGGIVVMVIQDQTKNFAKSLTSFRTIVDWCENIGFKLFECCIYSKDGKPGAWWNKRFRVDHEYIPIFLKGDKPKYFNKEPLKIEAKYKGYKWHGTQRLTNGEFIKIEPKIQKDLKCRGTIWRYTNSGQKDKNTIKVKHPGTFPDELASDIIQCFTQENDLVFDPMIGSGTVAVEAQKLNRKWLGFEINNQYIVDIIEPRLLNVV
jgi:DNA modification methylase